MREFFRGLGVTSARAHAKRVPHSVFSAPTEVQAAFLRGLFGADGCVSRVETGGKANRYVGLGSRSSALLKDVQRLLNAFGVRGRIYRITDARGAGFSYLRGRMARPSSTSPGRASTSVSPAPISSASPRPLASRPRRKQAALEALLEETARYRTKEGAKLVSRRGRRPGGRLQPHSSLSTTPTSWMASRLRTAPSTCTSTTRPATSPRST